MTVKNPLRRFSASALAIALLLGLLALEAHAETGWQDNYRGKFWPTSHSACLDGEALARIGTLQRQNPTLQYRYRSVNAQEYLPDEESQCRFVIDRRVGNIWVTTQVGSYLNFNTGSSDPCPQGATDSNGYCQPKSAGPPCPPCNGSNPINSGTGNKFQQENDYGGAAEFPLVVERYYNSLSRESGALGLNWRHYYQRSVLTLTVTSDVPTRVRVYRHDGKRYEFNLVSGVYTPDGDVSYRLSRTATQPAGWSIVTPDDETEEYDAEGKLISITRRNGQRQTLTYEYPSETIGARLLRVTDADGRTLQFTYDASNRISNVSLPNPTHVIAYAYDSSGRLASASYPDSTSRTYHYNETAYVGVSQPTALTGITDETNTRFAYFYYDAQRRAYRSEHAGGANRVSIAYGSGGSHTITDALGTARTFGHEVRGLTLVVPTGMSVFCSNCGGPSASLLEYDANANVTRSRDFKNVDTTYMYDTGRNLETSRTEAVGTPVQRTIITQWHSAFRLRTLIDEPNRRTTFTHDARGNVLTKTVTDLTVAANEPRTWTFTYNASGKLLTQDGPRTDVNDLTTYTYYDCTTGNECGQLHTITNARGHTTTYNAYNAHGLPVTITSPNGVVTTLSYDARQRLTSHTVGSETTAYEYWPTGLLKKTTLPDGAFVLNTFDAAHRLIRVEDGEGNRIEYTLDAAGNRKTESAWDPSGALARSATQTFNLYGLLAQQIGSAGTAAVTTGFGYDPNGNRVNVNAPLARNTFLDYDALYRLERVTDAAGGVTELAYDGRDNLVSLTDPRDLVTAYAYNGFDELVRLTSPDSGTTTSAYDLAGNLIARTDARDKLTHYTYDDLNRLTLINHPDRTISFTYDAGANGIGRRTGASDANHSLSWSYDALGRVIQKTQTVDTVTRSIGYAYNGGKLVGLTTPAGHTVTYGYSNGRITSVSVNGAPVLNGVLYDPFGPVSGWNWGNGTLAARTFDLDGNPTAVDSSAAYTLAYDDAFRVVGISDASDSTKSWSYGYDLLDRLTSAASSSNTLGLTYDANGNRLSQTGTQPATYSVSATSNRINSISGIPARSYAYDAAGNTLSYGSNSFTYDDSGRMSSVTSGGVTTSYVVNAVGQRIKKSNASGTRYFMYDEEGHLIGEYDASGAMIQEVVWMGDIPIATLRPSGSSVTVAYIHSDHLNTPRQITQPSGNAVVWRWDSDPFGTDAANSDPDGDGNAFEFNLRFAGQYFDAESGLHYNYFRDYDAVTGKYVQSDPIGLRGSLNTYQYVDASPIDLIDPRGLFNVTAYEVFDPNADSYVWRYSFSFKSCTIEVIERLGTRFIPRNVNRSRRFLGRIFPGKAGDVDIEDISTRCKCMQYDPELEKTFESKIGSTYETYNQQEAEKAISELRDKLKELEGECPKCAPAYNFDSILKNAADRGVESLRRRRPGG